MKLRSLFLFATLSLGAACQKPSHLGGSITNTYAMQYDNVRAYWIGPELVIAYEVNYQLPVQVSGFGTPVANQVARIVFNSARQAITTGADLDLIGSPLYPNASVTRYNLTAKGLDNVTQDPQPAALDSGTIKFSSVGTKVGDRLKGSIVCRLADGSDLNGAFDTSIVEP